MPNIPAVLEKTDFDALPEEVRSYFTEKDGKAYPNFTQPDIERLAVGLRKNRDDILEEKRKADEALKVYKEFGAPEEIQAKLDAKKEGQTEDAKAIEEKYKLQLDALKENAKKSVAELTDQFQTREQSLTQSIQSALAQSAITDAIVANEGNPKLLAPIVSSNVRFVEEKTDNGSKWVEQIIDGEGKPRYADALGTPMTAKEFVAELKTNKDYAAAFFANGGGGSGAPANQGRPTNGAKVLKRSDFEQRQAADPKGTAKLFSEGYTVVDD